MKYEKTIWKDRAVEKPRTFNVVNNPEGTITLIPAPGIVVEEGTPVNSANMNKIEQTLEGHSSQMADLTLGLQNHETAADPHTQYALDTDMNAHVGAGGTAHAKATTSADGFMSKEDKVAL